jgi:hypothetical protein
MPTRMIADSFLGYSAAFSYLSRGRINHSGRTLELAGARSV